VQFLPPLGSVSCLLFAVIFKQEMPFSFCKVNIHIHLNWMGDQQVVLEVHDKTCRYKRDSST
jgi:hypothetical protein